MGGSAANDPNGKLLRLSGRSENGDSKGAKLVTLLFTKREEQMVFEPSLYRSRWVTRPTLAYGSVCLWINSDDPMSMEEGILSY